MAFLFRFILNINKLVNQLKFLITFEETKNKFTMEIKNIYGAVIYSDDSKTIKETVENAVKVGASLDRASLDGASLVGARLVGASLVGARLDRARLVGAILDRARLVGASLDGAILDGARLEGARLDRASLDRASLVGARLDRASLDGAILDGARLDRASLDRARLDRARLVGAILDGAIKLPIYCKWSHGVTDGLIHIGCEKRSIEDWKKFLKSDEVIETERDTQEFKQIKAVICAYIAYLEVLND